MKFKETLIVFVSKSFVSKAGLPVSLLVSLFRSSVYTSRAAHGREHIPRAAGTSRVALGGDPEGTAPF